MFLDFGDAEFALPWLPAKELLWLLNYLPPERVIVTPVLRQSVIDHLLSGTPIEATPVVLRSCAAITCSTKTRRKTSNTTLWQRVAP
ncbi:hypothetical protein FHT77_005686 [Rhizobium sp. BK181]|nr:hypothetical protein [Rhizobium sp. BK181]